MPHLTVTTFTITLPAFLCSAPRAGVLLEQGFSARRFLTLAQGALPLVLLTDEHVFVLSVLPLPAAVNFAHCQDIWGHFYCCHGD